jgi:hypothetical protein
MSGAILVKTIANLVAAEIGALLLLVMLVFVTGARMAPQKRPFVREVHRAAIGAMAMKTIASLVAT